MQKLQRIILSISIFLLLFAGFFHPISAFTQDLGRHLITGKIIFETSDIPKVNLFSYTYPNFPFINTHWLSEVIFYLISQIFGSNSLLILTISTVLISFGLIFYFSLKRWNIIPLSIISILYFRVLFERTDVRPEIFSFLFLSIFIFVLYSYKEKFTRWILILPLIELLWVNMHIYFPIGIAVLGFFVLDELINRREEIFLKLRKKTLPKHFFVLLSIFVACSLIIVLNPNGIKGALYPLNVFNNYGYTIEENQSIFFLESLFFKSTIPFFKLSVILLFLSLILSFKKTKPIDWFLAICFTYLGASAVRNFPLFVFATFIPAVKSLSFVYEKLKFIHSRKNFQFFIFLFLIIMISWQITDVSKIKGFGFGEDPGAKKAADFFIENKLKGPIFNNFDIGSYLDYRFYNKGKVFIDGRPEAYPASFFQQTYIPMQDNPILFKQISNKYQFNTIFFSHTDQTPWANTFLKQIITDKNWKIIYLDDYIIILAKNNKENEELIKKFEVKTVDLSLYKDNLISLERLINFFDKTGLTNQKLEAYQLTLNLDQNFCPALYYIGNNLAASNNPLASIYITRFNNNCH